jgi:hypothetical protein
MLAADKYRVCVLVIGSQTWGAGDDFETAMKNARKANGGRAVKEYFLNVNTWMLSDIGDIKDEKEKDEFRPFVDRYGTVHYYGRLQQIHKVGFGEKKSTKISLTK